MPTHCSSPPVRVGRQQRLEPGVCLDLGGVALLAPLGRREQVAGDVAGGDPVAAQQHEREVREVLADARAGVEQVLDLGADVGHARAVLEAVRDHLHDLLERAQRRVGAHEPDELVDAQVVRLARVGEQELDRPPAVGVALGRSPGAGLRRRRRARGDAGADVDRERLVRLGDPELDHRGAVIVEVLVQPRLRLHAHAEVVDPLGRRRRRRHAQGVEVVGDRSVVAVVGQVADREVHQAVASLDTGADAPPK